MGKGPGRFSGSPRTCFVGLIATGKEEDHRWEVGASAELQWRPVVQGSIPAEKLMESVGWEHGAGLLSVSFSSSHRWEQMRNLGHFDWFLTQFESLNSVQICDETPNYAGENK